MLLLIGAAILFLFLFSGAIYSRPIFDDKPAPRLDLHFVAPPDFAPKWTPPNDASWRAYAEGAPDDNA